MMNGTIFNIQKFCVNDGPGIRTTVFMKGCPLGCIWCHNPESKSVKTEIFYDAQKCIGCKACAAVCENGCHIITEASHEFDRSSCIACGKCAKQCYVKALEPVGTVVTVPEVMVKVLRDKPFYNKSGGGLTVSGGEPMLQYELVKGLLSAAKENGLHTCMETCGYAKGEQYREIAEYVDLFLFDYKVTDPSDHQRYTGVDNRLILENLKMLDSMGAKTILRCPIIPTYNDNDAHLLGIASLANSLEHIAEIDIEPYHPLGSSKSDMLGKAYALRDLIFPDESAVKNWMKIIQEHTKVEVKRT